MKSIRKSLEIIPAAFVALALLMLFFCTAVPAQSSHDRPEESLSPDSEEGRFYELNDEYGYLYKNPGPLDFLKNFPGDIARYTTQTFRKENLLKIGAMVAVTGLMVAFDQQMLDATQRFGRSIGLKGTNRMKRAFTVLGFPIEVPRDLDTGLYFIGDGWTHTSIAATFFSYGMIAGDSRALQTASQLAEGMITTGMATQLLKHVTGRESPFVSTAPGGRWRPFPDQVEYHKRVPHFDAYPSGHLATAMMTTTVIAENYPNNKFVRPIGYTLMAVLSFEMVNNGVHWVSDYPLALAMGYSLGKIAVARGRKLVARQKNGSAMGAPRRLLLPYFSANQIGLTMIF